MCQFDLNNAAFKDKCQQRKKVTLVFNLHTVVFPLIVIQLYYNYSLLVTLIDFWDLR